MQFKREPKKEGSDLRKSMELITESVKTGKTCIDIDKHDQWLKSRNDGKDYWELVYDSRAGMDKIANIIKEKVEDMRGKEELTAMINVKLNSDGSLQEWPEIEESSGTPEYDQSAIIAVVICAPYPMPKNRLANDYDDLVLPI